MLSAAALPGNRHRILVAGGAGFIGGAVVRRLLRDSHGLVFNPETCGYASGLSSLAQMLQDLGQHWDSRHWLLRVDLPDAHATAATVPQANPDLVLHLAVESHFESSIEGLGAFIARIIAGIYNLLLAVQAHCEVLLAVRRELFRIHPISTGEVFGTLGTTRRSSETIPCQSRSPYSASKAASDHPVNALHHTYGLPVSTTNFSNHYSPWQDHVNLIQVVGLKTAAGEPILLYGNGLYVRDRLYNVYVDPLLLAATLGLLGSSYCIGCPVERSNTQVFMALYVQLEEAKPVTPTCRDLSPPEIDRPNHDRCYAINPAKMPTGFIWQTRHCFDVGHVEVLGWHQASQNWDRRSMNQANCTVSRLSTVQS